MISIIVAISEDLGIGKDNDLLWHLPGDLKRFKQLTLGKTVIMGRKTWFSLPRKPLQGRRNIVITDVPGEQFEGAETVSSVEGAVAACNSREEVFIIGGGSIYRQFMPLADRLHISLVHRSAPADIYFPEIDPSLWKEVHSESFTQGENEAIPYRYIIYDRIKSHS